MVWCAVCVCDYGVYDLYMCIYIDVINESEASNPNGPSDRNGSLRCSEFSFDRGWNMNKAEKPWKKHHQSKTIKLKKKVSKTIKQSCFIIRQMSINLPLKGPFGWSFYRVYAWFYGLPLAQVGTTSVTWAATQVPNGCQSLKPDMPGFFEAYDHMIIYQQNRG